MAPHAKGHGIQNHKRNYPLWGQSPASLQETTVVLFRYEMVVLCRMVSSCDTLFLLTLYLQGSLVLKKGKYIIAL